MTNPGSAPSLMILCLLLQLKLNGQQIFHEIPGEDMSEVATIKGKKRARCVGSELTMRADYSFLEKLRICNLLLLLHFIC